MSTTPAAVRPGWHIDDRTGRRIGDVADVGVNYLAVRTVAARSDLYVPATSIAHTDDATARVLLTVDMSEIAEAGWSTPPPVTAGYGTISTPSEARDAASAAGRDSDGRTEGEAPPTGTPEPQLASRSYDEPIDDGRYGHAGGAR